jgi:drug/metabolite transporter (DMT)-like permease
MIAPKVSSRAVSGLAVSGVTAAVSGVSVFVNSYGVHSVRSPAVYTTGKNFFAATFLLVFALITRTAYFRKGETEGGGALSSSVPRGWRLVALAYVAIVGGGVAFVMFFDGLARTSPVPAAFLHDTLVVWVALIAWPVLGNRLSSWNVIAIGLLVVGLVASGGGIGSLVVNSGNALVLGATVLWAAETVVIKELLSGLSPNALGVVRMGGGLTVLVTYLGITGQLGPLFSLDADALRWTVITGLLLGAYVASWMFALSRARAIDVTSILVASAVVTAILQAVVQHKDLAQEAWGLALIGVGTVAAVVATRRKVVYV